MDGESRIFTSFKTAFLSMPIYSRTMKTMEYIEVNG